MKRKYTCLAVLLLILVPAVSTATVNVHGIRFAPTVDAGGNQLHLRGAGLLRSKLFIRVYAGALYLPETLPPQRALAPVAKQLVLEYFHALKGKDIAAATRKKMADNVTAAQLQHLSARIDQLAGLYRDVRPGDRYALTHIPGEGVHLSLNGRRLGTVAGDDFARAAFAIWLGANPISERFRDRLLGDL
jgi:hypothetical protein